MPSNIASYLFYAYLCRINFEIQNMGKFVKFEGVTIKRIRPIEERRAGDKTFRTLKIDVEAPLGQYDKKPNVYQFEATYDKAIKEAQELQVGQTVNIGVDIRGNEWEKKETGEILVFNKLEIATVETVGGAKSNDGSLGVGSTKPPLAEPQLEEKDDLPF